MKYTSEQIDQARAEFEVFVVPSRPCDADLDAVARRLQTYDGPFMNGVKAIHASAAEGLPAGWAREHGKALLETAAALIAENDRLNGLLANADVKITVDPERIGQFTISGDGSGALALFTEAAGRTPRP